MLLLLVTKSRVMTRSRDNNTLYSTIWPQRKSLHPLVIAELEPELLKKTGTEDTRENFLLYQVFTENFWDCAPKDKVLEKQI